MTQPESHAAHILEVAMLDVRLGQEKAFETALQQALPLIRRQFIATSLRTGTPVSTETIEVTIAAGHV